MLDDIFGDGEWIIWLAGLIWKDMGLEQMDGFGNEATTSCVESVVAHCFQATPDSLDSTYTYFYTYF